LDEMQRNKIWAAAGYFPPIALTALIRKDELARFHGKQALATWVIIALAYVVSLIPSKIFAVIKWPVALTLYALAASFLLQGVISATKGKKAHLPLVGQYADALPRLNIIGHKRTR